MAAYFIVHRREITDPDTLKKYREGVGATIAKFGGKVLARADEFEVLEGDWRPGQKAVDSRPQRIVVIEFSDMATLKAWYGSKEYADLKALRMRSAVSDVVAVAGI